MNLLSLSVFIPGASDCDWHQGGGWPQDWPQRGDRVSSDHKGGIPDHLLVSVISSPKVSRWFSRRILSPTSFMSSQSTFTGKICRWVKSLFKRDIFSKRLETQEQQDWEPGKYYLASLNFGGLQDSSSFQVKSRANLLRAEIKKKIRKMLISYSYS